LALVILELLKQSNSRLELHVADSPASNLRVIFVTFKQKQPLLLHAYIRLICGLLNSLYEIKHTFNGSHFLFFDCLLGYSIKCVLIKVWIIRWVLT